MVEIPDSLVDRLKAREAVLVAGVGCGELAGAPGWPALTDNLAARLLFFDERAQVAKLLAAGRIADAVATVRDMMAQGVLRDAIRDEYPDGRALARPARADRPLAVASGRDERVRRSVASGARRRSRRRKGLPGARRRPRWLT
jgi:hypothetical protein